MCGAKGRAVRLAVVLGLGLVLGLGAAAAGALPAAAQPESARIEHELARGLKLFQDLEYRDAIHVLRPLRVDPDATRSQKLRALELIGISHLILGERAQAEEAFEDLLTIDAGYQLQHDDESPKIREFYDKVKREFLPGFKAGEEARLEHSAPRSAVAGKAVEIDAVVRVGIDRVKEMVLRWRRRGVLEYQNAEMRRRVGKDQQPSWRAEFTPPASRTAYAVDYYVEARNAAGGAIGRIGGPETPLSLPVGPGEGAGPWYSRWYVIAGGAVVLGVATAVALSATGGGLGDGTLDPGRVSLGH